MPSAVKPHPLRRRMMDLNVTYDELGLRLGKDPGLLSRYFRGVRPMPEGLAERCERVLDLEVLARRAEEKARADVLSRFEDTGEVSNGIDGGEAGL